MLAPAGSPPTESTDEEPSHYRRDFLLALSLLLLSREGKKTQALREVESRYSSRESYRQDDGLFEAQRVWDLGLRTLRVDEVELERLPW